jgi:hypothetical protein
MILHRETRMEVIMSRPQEICLEELDGAPEDERFVRCVALPGASAGLALDRAGAVRWMHEGPDGHGLCVSDDDRLVLLAGADAGEVAVERGHRQVVAPAGKPVVLMDQDLLILGDRRLRVHLHGETDELHAPERLGRSALLRWAAAAAAALTLGAGAGPDAGARGLAGSEPAPIEVRARPPAKPARKALDCTVNGLKLTGAGGSLVVTATCPANPHLRVGVTGILLDPGTGQPVSDTYLRVTQVTGTTVIAEAAQTKRLVKATKLRLYLPWY